MKQIVKMIFKGVAVLIGELLLWAIAATIFQCIAESQSPWEAIFHFVMFVPAISLCIYSLYAIGLTWKGLVNINDEN